MEPIEFQTRSEITGLKQHNSFQDAMNRAKSDPTVWKISFNAGRERIILVNNDTGHWVYRPIE